MKALRVELTGTLAYWTVVDDNSVPVALADAYLRHLHLGLIMPRALHAPMPATWPAIWGGARRAGGIFFPGSSFRAAALGMFVVMLRTTSVARAGSGQARVRGPGRINHVLAAVRELYKHAVADRALDASVLGAAVRGG